MSTALDLRTQFAEEEFDSKRQSLPILTQMSIASSLVREQIEEIIDKTLPNRMDQLSLFPDLDKKSEEYPTADETQKDCDQLNDALTKLRDREVCSATAKYNEKKGVIEVRVKQIESNPRNEIGYE